MIHKLGTRLLEQDGIQPDTIPPRDREHLDRLLAAARARLRRLGRLMLVSWVLFVAAMAASVGWVAGMGDGPVPDHIYGLIVSVNIALFLMATVLTLSGMVGSGSLRVLELNSRLANMEDLLAAVSGQLERLAARQDPPPPQSPTQGHG